MSRAVFVDTAAWYALADVDDDHHKQAAARMRRLQEERVPLVTSNHVAEETYTLCRVRLGATVASEFLRRLRRSRLTQRVFVSEAWEVAAEELLFQYDDQDVSYVDATSFVVMRQLGLRGAFTFDRHFRIFGFTLIGEDG